MKLTLDQALQKGDEAHKAGQIQEADRFYASVLQSQPRHPDANHKKGVLAVGIGNIKEALPFLKTAVEANPSIIQFWLSYINALIRLGKTSDAAAAFNQAKKKGFKGSAFDQIEKIMSELDGSARDTDPEGRGTSKEKSNILDTLSLDQATKLAKKKLKNGLSEEAKSLYEDILIRFPQNKKATDGIKLIFEELSGAASKNLDPTPEELQSLIGIYGQGHLQQALNQTLEMLKLFPKSLTLHNIRGAAHAGLGEFNEAIDTYKEALQINPNDADTYYNMGAALKDKGELDAAIDSYKKALKINPNDADTYYNMAAALKDKGELDAAIGAFKNAIKINPNYAEAYYNVGNTLRDKGELDAAIGAYKQTLKIDPNYANAFYNMGNTLRDKGELDAAIDSFKETLQIDPNYTTAYNNIGKILSNHKFTKPAPGLQEIITSLLNRKNYVRPSSISSAAISLLKVEPVIKELFERYHAGGLTRPLQETISVLTELPLLLALMSVCPLADLELEVFLTDIRFSLLSSISNVSASPKCLLFQSALALHCFTNEYIYNLTDQEAEELEALEISVKNTLSNGKQPHPKLILCLASYKALHNYEWAGLLIMTADIREVFIRQLLEPKQEGNLKTEIPILEEVSNKVSCKVRDQYEENPYPRWVDLGLRSKPAAISEIVIESKMRLFDNGIIDAKSPNILVAGCGTGQHSIQTATGFQNSKVLAIDLSLASLAYAKRKTDELGIQNIDYMHADILDLGKLDRQFDIIESAGVLHHMDDPMAGWKVLTGCLKPGGLMKIGLYSELARQHIVTVKDEISQSGSGASDAAIKSLRKDLIHSNKEHHISITKISDFYSLSELRDLLFHVQEHRFTIPQIQSCLSRLGLVFCGFDDNNALVQDFKRANTGANDPYDLDKWHCYEEANPYSFINMYQFWCQKVT
jgi:tetratricopeptide (TPR) repeat protein/2-polyprenyl-3-methyl-5-hydroxy-6-metoxy-1,4-benzoquinol methylase